MRPTPHQKLLLLQHRIYRSLRTEAEVAIGPTPASIRQYEREYQRDFLRARPFKPISKDALISQIRATRVTFVADFHTFSQAQRTALRLMRDATRPGEKWFIGLEMIPVSCQSALDDFQVGKTDASAFHKQIQYESTWGFPWENYAPIFNWAREQKIRLIALNQPKRSLYERDHKAAEIISETVAVSSSSRMIVLYGELHVSSMHLPACLSEVSRAKKFGKLSTLSIHQNYDKLYWELAAEKLEHEINAIQLKKDVFCVFSGTPWAKLQSLINWAEGGSDSADSAGSADSAHENSFDYLSSMKEYGEVLAELLSMKAPTFEKLSVKTIQEADFVESLEKQKTLSKSELSLVRFTISSNQRIYIPQASVAYLGTPSLNGAAELSAIHLLRSKSSCNHILKAQRDDFFRLLLENTFGFFGSLVINPHRKCDLLQDHISRHTELEGSLEPLPALSKQTRTQETHARRFAIEVLKVEDALIQGKLTEVPFSKSCSMISRLMAARYLGQILGKKLHRLLMNESILPSTVFNYCLPDTVSSLAKFEQRYIALLKLSAKAAIETSKREMI